MTDPVLAQELSALIASDDRRLAALRLVDALELPEGAIAGAFVRLAAFDRIHRHEEWTQLPRIDVVYYDPERPDLAVDDSVELELLAQAPRRPWRVRNLAIDRPGVAGLAEALDVYPDTADALAVRLDRRGEVEVAAAPFGLDDVLAGMVRPVSTDRVAELRRRVRDEKWTRRFPKLQLIGLD